MWWINKFGSVSGPYSDEQIRRGIKQNRFTKLHKISSDRQEWQRLDQTEFWAPVATAPEELDIPEEINTAKLGARSNDDVDDRQVQSSENHIDCPRVGSQGQDQVVASKSPSHKHKVSLLIATGAIAACVAIVVVCVTLFVGSGKVDFNAIKKRVLLVHGDGGVGTAFLVKMDGRKYVLTNDHVARGKTAPEMILASGRRISLGELFVAKDRDLARFEVDYDGDCFELSDKVPNNNDEVWVYGNSRGDDVITSLRGFVTGVGSTRVKVNAEFVRGNSGSPIVSTDGKVIAVASFLSNGDNGMDWTTRDTSFDGVRRFGIRPDKVEWVKVDKSSYEKSCARLEELDVYFKYLYPYLICDNTDLPEDMLGTLKLEHKDSDRRSFGVGGSRFHEMLASLSKSYAGQGGSLRKYQGLIRDREALIGRLNAAIESGEITLEKGKMALAEFDSKKDINATWENVKSKLRNFNAKRKEALMLASDCLSEIDRENPLMQHGYGPDFEAQSVDWYRKLINISLEQNDQKLKDLNKALTKLEKGDDYDEE